MKRMKKKKRSVWCALKNEQNEKSLFEWNER